MQKNKATTIYIYAEDTVTGLGKTGLLNIVVEILKDNGTIATITPTISPVKNGIYRFPATADNMNADVVVFVCSSVTANTKIFPVFIETQEVSKTMYSELTANHNQNDTFGKLWNDTLTIGNTINGKTDTIITNVNNVHSAIDALSSDVSVIDGVVDTINTKTDTLIANLNSLSANILNIGDNVEATRLLVVDVLADTTIIKSGVELNNSENNINLIAQSIFGKDIKGLSFFNLIERIHSVSVNKFINLPNVETIFYDNYNEPLFKLSLSKNTATGEVTRTFNLI